MVKGALHIAFATTPEYLTQYSLFKILHCIKSTLWDIRTDNVVWIVILGIFVYELNLFGCNWYLCSSQSTWNGQPSSEHDMSCQTMDSRTPQKTNDGVDSPLYIFMWRQLEGVVIVPFACIVGWVYLVRWWSLLQISPRSNQGRFSSSQLRKSDSKADECCSQLRQMCREE